MRGVCALGRRFELKHERDLAIGGHTSEVLAPQIELGRRGRGRVIRTGEPERVVRRAERSVVARFCQRLVHDIGIDGACEREALTVAGDDAHPDPRHLGNRERFDLTSEHTDLGVT
jgi:hypothetical protein